MLNSDDKIGLFVSVFAFINIWMAIIVFEIQQNLSHIADANDVEFDGE